MPSGGVFPGGVRLHFYAEAGADRPDGADAPGLHGGHFCIRRADGLPSDLPRAWTVENFTVPRAASEGDPVGAARADPAAVFRRRRHLLFRADRGYPLRGDGRAALCAKL